MREITMKNVLNTIIPILLTISYISGGEISANLATEINDTSPDSLIRVLINLEERFDAQSLESEEMFTQSQKVVLLK